MANRAAYNVKVINMSLGVSTGTDSTLRAKVNNAVNAGIVVVVAAGNNGPSLTIGDPGLANKVLTIGASNDKNELASYTSIGSAPSDPSMDYKPDLLAAGWFELQIHDLGGRFEYQGCRIEQLRRRDQQ